MKWYIASRQRDREVVKNVRDFLKQVNQEVPYDWTEISDLTPYEENKDLSSRVAEDISKHINDLDVFVLLSDKAGTDMYIELGIAINNNQNFKSPRIYLVGKHNNRSLMHFHPSIRRVGYIDEVYKLEKII